VTHSGTCVGLNRLAPFPFSPMFQNGPRTQGFAPENLFKPSKDSPPPRTPRAPLTAAGRSEDFPTRRERGQMQRPNHAQLPAPACLPMVGPEPPHPGALVFRNIRIRPPPVDDVNNLRHDGKCQRLPRFDGYSDPSERSIHIAGIRRISMRLQSRPGGRRVQCPTAFASLLTTSHASGRI
jgi:hypothetical protein